MGLDSLLQAAAALGFVLGLIVLAAWVMRRFGLAGPTLPAGADRRLHLVEVRAIDARRQLVLLRRDAVEHLVILSPSGETVVEAGIRHEGSKP